MKPAIPLHDPRFQYVPAVATDIKPRFPAPARAPILKLLDRVAAGTTTQADALTLAQALGVAWSNQ